MSQRKQRQGSWTAPVDGRVMLDCIISIPRSNYEPVNRDKSFQIQSIGGVSMKAWLSNLNLGDVQCIELISWDLIKMDTESFWPCSGPVSRARVGPRSCQQSHKMGPIMQCIARKPSVYADVKGTFSPLCSVFKGWGGSGRIFPDMAETIHLEKNFTYGS